MGQGGLWAMRGLCVGVGCEIRVKCDGEVKPTAEGGMEVEVDETVCSPRDR